VGVRIKETGLGYPGPNDLDIKIGKIKVLSVKSPFLQISESGIELYSDIA
jgi:hypothetical protein